MCAQIHAKTASDFDKLPGRWASILLQKTGTFDGDIGDSSFVEKLAQMLFGKRTPANVSQTKNQNPARSVWKFVKTRRGFGLFMSEQAAIAQGLACPTRKATNPGRDVLEQATRLNEPRAWIVEPKMIVAHRRIKREDDLLKTGPDFLGKWDFGGAQQRRKMKKLAGEHVAAQHVVGVIERRQKRRALRQTQKREREIDTAVQRKREGTPQATVDFEKNGLSVEVFAELAHGHTLIADVRQQALGQGKPVGVVATFSERRNTA